jgi:hypothetical protein
LSACTVTFSFITKNWSTIKPLVEGIAIAWGIYKLNVLRTAAVTKGAALAQWALNAAMNANPVGIIITGIGLLIGAGILLYKNWDVVKAKALALWQGFKSAFAPLAGFFSGIWSGIKAGFRGLINFLIAGLNLWIKFQLMPLNLLIKGINLIPGHKKIPQIALKIPKLPKFALGTQYFKGGLAQTDERGGEIKEYPNGTKIIPADKSE